MKNKRLLAGALSVLVNQLCGDSSAYDLLLWTHRCRRCLYLVKYCQDHHCGELKGPGYGSAAGLHQYGYLSFAGLSSRNDFGREKCKPVQLYCPDLYPAHVDELLLRTLAWQTLLEKTG